MLKILDTPQLNTNPPMHFKVGVSRMSGDADHFDCQDFFFPSEEETEKFIRLVKALIGVQYDGYCDDAVDVAELINVQFPEVYEEHDLEDDPDIISNISGYDIFTDGESLAICDGYKVTYIDENLIEHNVQES